MAVSLKVDTEDFPSIFQMLGLGDPRPQGEAPPVDSSLAGAPPEAPPQPKSVPTKLGRLQQIIQASQGNLDHPTMTDEHSSPTPPPDSTGPTSRSLSDIVKGPSPQDAQLVAASQGNIGATPDAGPIVSRDMSQMPNVSNAPAVTEHKSWAQQHPTLLRILKGAATTAEGGAAGTGAMTLGEGFQRAHEITDPFKHKMEDAALAEKQATIAHTKAGTEQMQSQVTLPNGLTVPFALASKLYPTLVTEQGKDKRNTENVNSRESIAGDKQTLALRKQGLKLDANGKQVPLGRDEMSETEQAALDLKQSQSDAADAHAALSRFSADPNNIKYKQAQERLRLLAQNAGTAAGKLGLDRKKYLADYLGTDENGNALPGATTDEQGRPIGPRMANAGKVPASRLRPGDLAHNAIGNLNDIVGYIHGNPELFGSLGGRITTVREMMGSDEPAIRQIAIAAHNYALASTGVHGVRSKGAVQQTEDELLNRWKDGPEAILGGIAQAKKSLQEFVDDQKYGSRARPADATTQITPPNASAEVYAADGKTLTGHVVNGRYVPLQKQKQ